MLPGQVTDHLVTLIGLAELHSDSFSPEPKSLCMIPSATP